MSRNSSLQELYKQARSKGTSYGSPSPAGTALSVGRVESVSAGVHSVTLLDETGESAGTLEGIRTVPAAQSVLPGTLVLVLFQPPSLPAILLTDYSSPTTTVGAYLSSRYFTTG